MMKASVFPIAILWLVQVDAFLTSNSRDSVWERRAFSVQQDDIKSSSIDPKQKLLGLIGKQGYVDPVLADPETREPLRVVTSGVLLGGNENSAQSTKVDLQSTTNTYRGTSDTFVNLLEAVTMQEAENKDDNSSSDLASQVTRRLVPFIPPPLRSSLSTAGFPVGGEDYILRRDLFTSPAVSFAYERGWRQNFATAGFPGPDKEAELAMDYFSPAIAKATEGTSVLVDMSCATGLFTRRFTKSGKYNRVLGCDYSESMLQEARRRIQADPTLSPRRRTTRLDLIRCDVGKIPFKTDSIDAFHAGAAMHCWPDLPLAASEIYRVLKPGGRYFATTFLSSWFNNLPATQDGSNGPSRQGFQYFESTDQLRKLMEEGGFSPEKVSVEVLQPAAVVIRCEK